jgi:hypothetical protein
MEERLEKSARQVGRQNLSEPLEKHPELKERFEMILDIVENVSGEVEKADEAERRAIQAVRQLGNEILLGWAQRQQQKKENECDQRGQFSRKEKNALLVHGLRKNPDRGANLSAGSSRAGRAAVPAIRRSRLPRLFALVAAGDGGFWGGQPLCRSRP